MLVIRHYYLLLYRVSYKAAQPNTILIRGLIMIYDH